MRHLKDKLREGTLRWQHGHIKRRAEEHIWKIIRDMETEEVIKEDLWMRCRDR